jgi:hypothetical protein
VIGHYEYVPYRGGFVRSTTVWAIAVALAAIAVCVAVGVSTGRGSSGRATSTSVCPLVPDALPGSRAGLDRSLVPIVATKAVVCAYPTHTSHYLGPTQGNVLAGSQVAVLEREALRLSFYRDDARSVFHEYRQVALGCLVLRFWAYRGGFVEGRLRDKRCLVRDRHDEMAGSARPRREVLKVHDCCEIRWSTQHLVECL